MTADFISFLEEIFPIFFCALVLCFIFGWTKIKESYKDNTLQDWVIQYSITALTTAVFAVAMVLILPAVFPNITFEVKMGIMLYICIFGVKTFQSIMRHKLGLEIIDKKDVDSLEKKD